MQTVLAACFLVLTQLSATASLLDWVDKYPSNDDREYHNFFELDLVKKTRDQDAHTSTVETPHKNLRCHDAYRTC